VDAVSHLIFGRALAAIAPRPAHPDAPRRGLTAATVIASIAPDVDAVLMPFGWDRYLLWHQRGTHALVGTLADAIVFALLLRVLLGLRSRGALAHPAGAHPLSPMSGRGQGEGQPARLSHLVLAAWLGCLGHVLLDVISGGTIRLFAPFSTAPYGVPWMAMADPLIAVPLAIFLLASWRWRQPAQVARFAWVALITLAAIVGIKEVSRRAAIDAYARSTEGQPGVQSPAIESAWASFTRWFAFDRAVAVAVADAGAGAAGPQPGPGQMRVFEIDAWRGTVRPLFSRDVAPPGDAGADALIAASARLETVRHLHALFDLTFAEIRPHPPERDGGGTNDGRLVDVLWSDIRFCWPTDCALWFGGTFDRSTGALREQVVLVGSMRQTRQP
jgi:LexA-binding, inner membrane-associated putative hydrolase